MSAGSSQSVDPPDLRQIAGEYVVVSNSNKIRILLMKLFMKKSSEKFLFQIVVSGQEQKVAV